MVCASWKILCFAFFQTMSCFEDTNTGSLVLRVDYSTECFHGDHLVAFPFALLFFIVFSLGYPALCAWLLRKAFRPGSTMTEQQRLEQLGYLFRHLRKQVYW